MQASKQLIWGAVITALVSSVFGVVSWSFESNFSAIVKNQDAHSEKLDKQFEKISDLSDRISTLEGMLRK